MKMISKVLDTTVGVLYNGVHPVEACLDCGSRHGCVGQRPVDQLDQSCTGCLWEWEGVLWYLGTTLPTLSQQTIVHIRVSWGGESWTFRSLSLSARTTKL